MTFIREEEGVGAESLATEEEGIEVTAERESEVGPSGVYANPPVIGRAMKGYFFRTLKTLLPMRNPTGQKDENLVIRYAHETLSETGRVVEFDGLHSLYAPAAPGLSGPKRAIVAHTDSVNQRLGKLLEPVRFLDNVFSSVRELRPIGGDDKVGVAVALTLAKYCPYLDIVLPADEESGCTGSRTQQLPEFDLMVQCDRRGTYDLVCDIFGRIASDRATEIALGLLPHRAAVEGMTTDVGKFSQRGICRNAFNMSCGYFECHTNGEWIFYPHAKRALVDAFRLIHMMPEGVEAAPEPAPIRTYAQGYRGDYYTTGAGIDRDRWQWDDEGQRWECRRAGADGRAEILTREFGASMIKKESLATLVPDGSASDVLATVEAVKTAERAAEMDETARTRESLGIHYDDETGEFSWKHDERDRHYRPERRDQLPFYLANGADSDEIEEEEDEGEGFEPSGEIEAWILRKRAEYHFNRTDRKPDYANYLEKEALRVEAGEFEDSGGYFDWRDYRQSDYDSMLDYLLKSGQLA